MITSQNSKGPSRDWLSLVKSTQAKNKINQWFKSELKEDNILRGKELVTNYCKSKNIVLSDLLKKEFVEACLRKYGFRDWDSIYAAIGHGGLKEGQIVNRLLEEYEKKHKKEITDAQVLEAVAEIKSDKVAQVHHKGGIIVQGSHDVAVHFSKCCSPVPGDEIVGFVTRGRGVSIHRTDCINVMNLSEEERRRLIDAEWSAGGDSGEESCYNAEIQIYANNRNGILVDISRIFTENNIELNGLTARKCKQDKATITANFAINGKEQLAMITAKLRGIESVLDVERTRG